MTQEAEGMVHCLLTVVARIKKILFRFVNTAVSQAHCSHNYAISLYAMKEYGELR